MSKRHTGSQRGFTLVETMVAMAIMAIGLLGAAALMSQMSVSSNDSRYMSVEALLASEKLEDLNHFQPSDPNILVTAGASVGDLVTDMRATVGTTPVDYFDTVQISSGAGAMVETTSATNAAGVLTYTTTTHSPDGSVAVNTGTVQPAPTPDMLSFKRHWIIEKDVPEANVLRITVRVDLIDGTRPQAATFQSSMVRPGPQP